MEIKGKLIKKLEVQSGISKAGKEWKKQACVVETDNDYNNQVCITAFGDKTNDLDKLKLGEDVKISCNVYSREYKGKYYNQIDGWFFSSKKSEIKPTDFVTSDDMPF